MSEDTIKMELHELLSQFINDSSQMKTRVEQLKSNIQQAWGCLLKLEGTMKIVEDPELLSTILLAFKGVCLKKAQAPTFADASTQTSRRNVTFCEGNIEEVEFCEDQTTDGATAMFVAEPIVAPALVTRDHATESVLSVPQEPAPSGHVSSRADAITRPTKNGVFAGKTATTNRETPRTAQTGPNGNFSGVNARRRLTTPTSRMLDPNVTPITVAQMQNLQKSKYYPSKGSPQTTPDLGKRTSLHSENFHSPTKKANLSSKSGAHLRTAPNERSANRPDPPLNQRKLGETGREVLASKSAAVKSTTSVLADRVARTSTLSETMPSRCTSSVHSRTADDSITRFRIRNSTAPRSFAEPSLKVKLRRD